MCFATLGWGVWWVALVLARIAPEYAPSMGWVYGISSTLGFAGLLTGLLCIRAGLVWLLLTAIPLFASASLLSMPWLLPEGGGMIGRYEVD